MRYMATPRKRYFVFRHVPITLAEIAHDHAACVSVTFVSHRDAGLLPTATLPAVSMPAATRNMR